MIKLPELAPCPASLLTQGWVHTSAELFLKHGQLPTAGRWAGLIAGGFYDKVSWKNKFTKE